MNVKDFESSVDNKAQEDRLQLIIAQQKSLMEKYHEIEAEFRLTPDCPVDLDDGRGQLLIKDFAWRTTEELAEALDALKGHTVPYDPDILLHGQEEVADAFHFLIELFILSGAETSPDFLGFQRSAQADSLDYLFLSEDLFTGSPEEEAIGFIQQLGMVCHTLKNKPWKTTHMLTDKPEFYRRLLSAFNQFCKVARAFDMDAQELFDMYFRKAQVNKFRQESHY